MRNLAGGIKSHKCGIAENDQTQTQSRRGNPLTPGRTKKGGIVYYRPGKVHTVPEEKFVLGIRKEVKLLHR